MVLAIQNDSTILLSLTEIVKFASHLSDVEFKVNFAKELKLHFIQINCSTL